MRVESRIRKASPWLALAAILLATLSVSSRVGAHALAPSLLSLSAAGDGDYRVTWKTPLQRVDGGRLEPVLPGNCQRSTEPSGSVAGTAVVQRWAVACGDAGLAGKTVKVEGIEASKADVLLRIELPDGSRVQRILKPGNPGFRVPADQSWYAVFGQYLGQGYAHLLAGLDHVLFVVALTLLVGPGRALIWTITGFTLGHSVTLSAAVLGYVSFPQPLAEILIALTILLTFAGVVNRTGGSLLRRHGPALGFGFGLLHGLGFAGALTELGLPPGDIPLALLAFNVGIELGQLMLVGLLLILLFLIRSRPLDVVGKLGWMPLYAAGTLSGFWFWQRLLPGF